MELVSQLVTIILVVVEHELFETTEQSAICIGYVPNYKR